MRSNVLYSTVQYSNYMDDVLHIVLYSSVSAALHNVFNKYSMCISILVRTVQYTTVQNSIQLYSSASRFESFD